MLIRSITAVLATLVAGLAAAQTYPVKPIRMIVPTEGGAYDTIVRAMQPLLLEELGQPIVVETRAGAGGVVGLQAASRAEPSGYTLLLLGFSQAVLNPLVVGKVPYDPVRDFTHIAMLGELHMALYVHSSLNVENMKGFVDYAKANPGRIAYGSSGIGQIFHLAGEVFSMRTGVEMVHVPYKGTPQALQDFFSGRTQMMFYPPASNVLDRVKQGTIRPLGVVSERRLPGLPGTPTFDELGLSGLAIAGWAGISGPAQLPRPVVTRMNEAFNKVIPRSELTKVYDAVTISPMRTTPEAMTARIQREISYWSDIIQKLGIKPEG